MSDAKEQIAERSEPNGESISQEDALREILAKLDMIGEELGGFVSENEKKERAFDELYRQLESQREEYSFQLRKPMIMDMIALYDRLVGVASGMKGKRKLAGRDAADTLESFIAEALEILSKQGVTSTETVGGKVDYSFQRGIERIEIDDPEQDNIVERIIRKGFRHGNTVIRSEDVAVTKARKQPPAADGGKEHRGSKPK